MSANLKNFLAVLFLVLLSASAWAADLYVDAVNGNDAWDGQAAVWDGAHGPKKTISAFAGIGPGNTIHVAAGTYNSEAFPQTWTGISLLGASSQTCIINGGPGDTNLFILGNSSSLSNLTINFASTGANDKTINVTGTSVTISNNHIRQAGATPNVGWGMDFNPGSSGTVSGNTITGFVAGIYTNTTNSVVIEKNTIQAKNNCVHYNNSGALTMRGNILTAMPSLDSIPIAGNGRGLYDQGSGTLTNDHNCYFNNKINIEGSAVGPNSIFAYPRFVDPWNNDLSLYNDSPCIGAWSGANIGADQTSGQAGSPYVSTTYVSASGSDTTGNGTQVNPFRTIRTGQKYALDKIVVMAGSYTPTDILQIGEGRTISGVGREDVTITSAQYPLAIMHSDTRLDGCSIAGSYPGPLPYPLIYVRQANNATIADCELNMTGAATLSACVYYHYSSGHVISTLTTGGTVGIYSYYSTAADPKIRKGSTVSVEACTIVDYDSYGIGTEDDTVYVKDCIIASNPSGSPVADTRGTWNYLATTGAISVTYSDVYNNDASYYQTTTGVGTLSADALFVDAAGGNYNLDPGSPCIDTGDPALFDPDGTRKDMGAFAFYQTPARTTTTTSTTTTTIRRSLRLHEATSSAGAYMSYSFNATQAEPVTIIIEEPGPPRRIVFEQTFTSQVGENSGTFPFLKFGVKKLPAGVYNYRIIFRASGQVTKGKVLHKPGLQ